MPRTSIPGHYHRSFRVQTAFLAQKAPRGDDGLPLKSWSIVDDLMASVTYVGDLERLDQRWNLVLQWVDLEGNGHRIALPHEVVDKIIGHAENIMGLCCICRVVGVDYDA